MPRVEGSESRLADRAFVVAVVVGVVPILVAAIRAIANDWAPVGDDAVSAIRAHDVLAGHVPLLGLWSSASLSAGVDLNHPGPLLFDALALPVNVFGHATGTALGMAVINALCVVGIAVFARRQGGALLGVTAALVVAVLSWTAGSEALYVPWPAHAMILPFLFFMVLVWAVACGDLVALPWAAGAGSFVLETHLGYTVLVPVLGAVAVVAFVMRARAGTEPAEKVRRSGIITVGVVALCWIQPVIDQLTGNGNLGHLLESGGGDADRAGFGYGARLLATVVGLPPWWFRPSFQDSFVRVNGWRAPSPVATALSLVAVAAVLGVCWWVARRARDRECSAATVVAGIGLGAGLVSVAIFPLDNFEISTHSLRWMWPLSAFISFSVLATVVRRVATAERRTWATVGLAGAVVVVAVLNVPMSDQGGGPNSDVAAIPGAQELTRQVGSALDDEDPVLVDSLFLQRFGDPYGPTVLAGLDERGVDFVVRDPMLVSHFGTERRADPGDAKSELLLRYGDEARTPPAGAEQVALIEGLDAGERREQARLRDEISEHVERDGIALNDAGERALVAGSLPILAAQLPGPFDLDALFDSREISLIGASGWLDADEPVQRAFARFSELQGTADSRTVALFLRERPGRG